MKQPLLHSLLATSSLLAISLMYTSIDVKAAADPATMPQTTQTSDTAQAETSKQDSVAQTQNQTASQTETPTDAKKAGTPQNTQPNNNDTFIPSETISEDLAVSFPVDI